MNTRISSSNVSENEEGDFNQGVLECTNDKLLCKKKIFIIIFYYYYYVLLLYIVCFGVCCDPCLFCFNASDLFGYGCLWWLMGCCYLTQWIPLTALRKKARSKYNIKGNICCDCLASLFCPCCTNCQIANEIQVQGYLTHFGGPPRRFLNNVNSIVPVEVKEVNKSHLDNLPKFPDL